MAPHSTASGNARSGTYGGDQAASDSTSSANVRLFVLGLVLALVSVLYPRLPYYLPTSIGSRLPFTGDRADLAARGKPWTRLQQYQAGVPAANNHDPFDVQGPADELRLRLLSKERKTEQEKHDKRVQRDSDERERMAMDENRVHTELPVYFVKQAVIDAAIDPVSDLGQTLSRVGDEILEHLRPQTVILLMPKNSTSQHVTVASADAMLYSAPSLLGQAVRGDAALGSYVLSTFAYATPPVSATAAKPVLEAPAGPVYAAMFGGKPNPPNVVAVSLPVNEDGGWTSEQMYDAGHALIRVRQKQDDVVVIGVGNTRPAKNPTSKFVELLTDALTQHTSHPRHNALAALYSGTKGVKPTKAVSNNVAALYAVVGAAGEAEGEQIDQRGGFWRFGALPLK